MARGPAPPKGFERIHAMLGAALRAAAPADHPASLHRDGPLPIVSGRGQLGLALLCAEVVDAHVPADGRKRFDEAVKLARRYHDGKPVKGERNLIAVAEELRTLRPRLPVLEVARGAVAAARSLDHGGATSADVGRFARLAAESVVQVLGGAPDRGGPEVRAFLERLDEELLLRELQAQLDERGVHPSTALESVRFRPAGSGRLPALILARLDGGGYGLWTKQGPRWQWLEGRRDDILASVPDSHFAAAVEATR
jgi:hypothetical protein